MMKVWSRLRSFGMAPLIALVIVFSIGVVFYVQVSVKRIEEELPIRVMQEKRDMQRVSRNYYAFLTIVDAAKDHPNKETLESVREHLAAVTQALRLLRDRYSFNTLIGASALHSVLSPAVEDVQIWLKEGFGDLPPSSPVVLELIATRTRDTLNKVYDKADEADRIAYEILQQQTNELRLLRSQLVVPLTALALLAAGIIWLASRQHRLAKRQQAAEAATKQAQLQLQHAIESISEGFALFDSGERLVLYNSRYRRMFTDSDAAVPTTGMTFEEIVKDVSSRGVIVDTAGRAEEWVAERLRSFRDPVEAHVYQTHDRRWIQVDERKTDDGGTVAVYSDITELKQREIDLLAAMERAEAASKAKGAFLANVSHELRTPLTSILGFTRLIQKRLDGRILPIVDIADPKVARAVQQVSHNIKIILSEGARLTSLINNVLDLAKIESGELEWELEPIMADEVISQAAAATEFLIREKGLLFTIALEPGLPAVLGDRDKVIQVIINLVSNAVKFTDTGVITCRAQLQDNGGGVVISVSDTGCGISEKNLDIVFEQFRQVGNTLTEKPAGTGLGLPICKEIVNHLGGQIWVTSTVNKGSTFSFTLPKAA